MKDTIAIIGYGRFGALLAEILKPYGQICIHDPFTKEKPEELDFVSEKEALECDTLFYCVPISEFEKTVRSHLLLLKDQPSKLIVDVLSVKSHPKNVLLQLVPEQHELLLTHPMFGPDSVRAYGIKDLPIILDPIKISDKRYAKWKDIFATIGLNIIELSSDEHDKKAAYSQGITHFIGRILGELNIPTSSIDSVGAKKLHEIKEQVCNDTWQLFHDLQNFNPYTLKMRVELGHAQDKIYNKLLPNRIYRDKLVVGIQGGKGSFNEQAARYYLERNGITDFQLVYLFTTENVLRALHEGEVDRGQFAIHNSVGGIVTESVEAMSQYNFQIVEEFAIQIAHTLMIRSDATLQEVDTIMSHPQALRQCAKNLAQRYPKLKGISGEGELVDHARVAELLSKGELPKNIGTIGSRVLSEIYGLKIVEENLQDLQENFTSFLWVERRK